MGQGKGPDWERAQDRRWGQSTGTRDRTGKGHGLKQGMGVATGDGEAMWGRWGGAELGDSRREKAEGRGTWMGDVGQRDAMLECRSTRCVILLNPLPPCPQQHWGHITALRRSDGCVAIPERPRGFGCAAGLHPTAARHCSSSVRQRSNPRHHAVWGGKKSKKQNGKKSDESGGWDAQDSGLSRSAHGDPASQRAAERDVIQRPSAQWGCGPSTSPPPGTPGRVLIGWDAAALIGQLAMRRRDGVIGEC